ncbi:MAG TPA: M2 family metallopeptidase [Balneolaceae bacterium]|nr:M2 family metallopeptidase [Balneolaceae bacterium]
MFKRSILYTFLALLIGCQSTDNLQLQEEVQTYLDQYTEQFQPLYYAAAKAAWRANTYIVEGDTATANAVQRTSEALAAFTGSEENITKAQKYLERKEDLKEIQVRQLKSILYAAANNPQTVDSLVSERIRLENELNSKLYGFTFMIDDEEVTTNDIDQILKESTSLEERLKAWKASKEVGKVLKDGLAKVRDLRNETVQALGYDNYFAYQVSEYGMSVEEMMDLMEQITKELYPLYRELHTYARYELAEKYGVEEVPDMLPAHWLPNRWGQSWAPMVEIEGMNLNAQLQDKTAEDLVHIAEDFYVSLGFDELPQSFWEKSSLYPLPPEADYKKNNHASAWHLDLKDDVRSLMSVEPNAEWYETTHHELGHIYYYMSYSNPNVPLLLRTGANRAFHEAIGSMIGLASMQKPYLAEIGLLPEDAPSNEIKKLLKDALNNVVFIPFSAGLMTHFEHALYVENLPKDQFNDRWWALKKKYQGIVPPNPRSEGYNDAASKTHIINDAAQYYDYALSKLILFQLHNHIATEILNQDPHATNYYGSKEVGEFLSSLMEPGATVDWNTLIKEATGNELSAQAMVEYFQPLMEWLKEQNEGREYTLPKL